MGPLRRYEMKALLATGTYSSSPEGNAPFFSHKEAFRLLPANNFRSPLKGRQVLERLLSFVCGERAVMGRGAADPVDARRVRRVRLLPIVESPGCGRTVASSEDGTSSFSSSRIAASCRKNRSPSSSPKVRSV